MASAKCSIDGCKRSSDILCDHCQEQVCTKHYIEHVKSANVQLTALSDELNALIDTMQQYDHAAHVFQEIERWREESHRRIDEVCEEKKQQLTLEISQKMDNQMKTLRELGREVKELIDEGDASFKQIENIKKNIEQCQKQCQVFETDDYFRLNVKPISLDVTLLSRELFTGDGTLLSLEHQIKLNEFYGQEGQKWVLIYKGTRDGFSGNDFHRCCNNHGPTITVIQSAADNYLFGGYTSTSWKSIQNYACDNNGPFLFTLTNPHGIPPTKYLVRIPTYSIHDQVNFGPTFGRGHDLYVSSDSHKNNSSYFNFSHSYNDTTGRGSMTFTGSKNFRTDDIEVYGLIQA